MKPTNVHDAKTHFSRLIERVQRGEEVVIAKAGKPVARLVPYTTPGRRRKGGQWKGLVRVSEDFDAPLPEEVDRVFRGEAE